MASEKVQLAKAYVQIVPSARGISGAISKEVGSEATAAGRSAGLNIVGAIKGAIVAAGIGTAIKNAINEGAALQQSIGGIETLFKGSADTVRAYADEAYKSAGLSANAYMEQVTSFSASLLQSLGGDTAKAAEAANAAIVAMADNSNKMGTDIQAIQNAYQGFAKQNYTMLDNLKLGYGGTKGEMERLLKDAEKLTKIKYDITNLNDVYSAIQVIQDELGITGTTALEAEKTFTGSFAAMKAAASNLLGALTLGEDIKPSLDALSETFYTFVFDNLMPMLGGLVSRLPDVFRKLLSESLRVMRKIASNSSDLVAAGADMVKSFITGILEFAPYIVEAAISLMASFGRALIEFDWFGLGRQIIEEVGNALQLAAAELFGEKNDRNFLYVLAEKLRDAIPKVVEVALEVVSGFVEFISNKEAIYSIAHAAATIMGALVAGVIKAIPSILEKAPEIVVGFAKAIIGALPILGEAMVQFVAHLGDPIKELVGAAFQWGADLIKSFIDGIKSFFTGLADTVKDAAGVVKDFLGFSEPDKGPLSNFHTFAPDMMRLFAHGIRDNESLITDQIASSFDVGAQIIDYGMAPRGNQFQPVQTGVMDVFEDDTPPIVIDLTLMTDGVVTARRQINYTDEVEAMRGVSMLG